MPQVPGFPSCVSRPAAQGSFAECTEAYTVGTGVTLTATADAGTTFGGWSGGGCAGTGTCMVTMNMAQTVTALEGRGLRVDGAGVAFYRAILADHAKVDDPALAGRSLNLEGQPAINAGKRGPVTGPDHFQVINGPVRGNRGSFPGGGGQHHRYDRQ